MAITVPAQIEASIGTGLVIISTGLILKGAQTAMTPMKQSKRKRSQYPRFTIKI